MTGGSASDDAARGAASSASVAALGAAVTMQAVIDAHCSGADGSWQPPSLGELPPRDDTDGALGIARVPAIWRTGAECGAAALIPCMACACPPPSAPACTAHTGVLPSSDSWSRRTLESAEVARRMRSIER